MGISTVLALISSIPKLFQVIKLIKPIKEEVEKAENKWNDIKDRMPPEDVDINKLNISKHSEVAATLKKYLLPKIKDYGFDEYDIDTMIRFVVLFIRKVKKLRRFKG